MDRTPLAHQPTLHHADPARLHHDYARARTEFLEALRAVVAEHDSQDPAEVHRECQHLLGLLA